MKNLITFTALAFYGAIMVGCGKNNDYTAGTDHTSGLTTVRKWSGSTDGYFRYDSTYYDSAAHTTKHKTKAKLYSRNITDSLFALEKYNDFTLKALTHWVRYRSTDSAAKLVKFDTIFGSQPISYVKFNYGANSVNLEIHRMYEQDPETGNWYQDHWYLHTVD